MDKLFELFLQRCRFDFMCTSYVSYSFGNREYVKLEPNERVSIIIHYFSRTVSFQFIRDGWYLEAGDSDRSPLYVNEQLEKVDLAYVLNWVQRARLHFAEDK